VKNPETHSVLVTLPLDLFQEIDKLISTTGLYSNKPDFVTCAIRQYFMGAYKPEIKMNADKIYMTFAAVEPDTDLFKIYIQNKMLSSAFGKKEDVKSIMMKLPKGLVNFMSLIESFSGLPNKKELIRCCIVKYMKNLMPGWDYSFADEKNTLFTAEQIKAKKEEIDEIVNKRLMDPEMNKMWRFLNRNFEDNETELIMELGEKLDRETSLFDDS